MSDGVAHRALKVAVIDTGGWGAQHARIPCRRRDTELVGIVGRDGARTAVRMAYARPSMSRHIAGNCGIVLAVVPTLMTLTPGTLSPITAAKVAIR